MTLSDVALQRLHNHRLLGTPLPSPTLVIDYLCAVQSQDYTGAKWGIAQRLADTNNNQLDEAFNSGKILRTHVLRPTWHFVLPKDIRWLLALTGPRVSRIMEHYNRKLDLDRKLFDKTNDLLANALADNKYLTRAELSVVLEENGIPAKGQRLGHIVSQAELDAVICSGPLRGKQFTYALLDDRAPKSRIYDRDQALAEITRRYFVSHGPALLQDCAWWSGLTVADIKLGVSLNSAQLVSVSAEGKTYWQGASAIAVQSRPDSILLLPNYDEYLISYKDYAPIFNDEVKKLNKPFGNALLAHIIVMNGQVIGGWKRTITNKKLVVRPDILIKLNRADNSVLLRAAQKYGKFLSLPVEVIY